MVDDYLWILVETIVDEDSIWIVANDSDYLVVSIGLSEVLDFCVDMVKTIVDVDYIWYVVNDYDKHVVSIGLTAVVDFWDDVVVSIFNNWVLYFLIIGIIIINCFTDFRINFCF